MSYFKNDKQAYVLLADGTIFEGFSFGALGTAYGEVVFTTGMTGFQEVLTDPAAYGQIVLQTYPLIGNCGVNRDDMESRRGWASGYIVKEWCEAPSNFRTSGTINDFLRDEGIVGIWGIDTRALTRHLRDHGTMMGCITTGDILWKKEELLKNIANYQLKDPVGAVSVSEKVWRYSRENRANHVALIDYGYKKVMMRNLLSQNCNVTVMPATTTLAEIRRLNPDGILLTGGPGDPNAMPELLKNVKEYTQYGKPIFATGLGHALLAMAMGAKVEKMHHGHRGANQPVKDLNTGMVFATNQFHGYQVMADTLPEAVGKVRYINLNDQSCEGIEYTAIHSLSLQFSPESTLGVPGTDDFYRCFTDLMERGQLGCL